MAPLAQLEDCLVSDCGIGKTTSSVELPVKCIAICARRSLSVQPEIDFKECIEDDCGLKNGSPVAVPSGYAAVTDESL